MNRKHAPEFFVIVAETESNVEGWLKSVTNNGDCHTHALIQAEAEPLAGFAARVSEELDGIDARVMDGNIDRVYWLRGRLIGPHAAAARAVLLQAVLGSLQHQRDRLTIVPWPAKGRARQDDSALLAAPGEVHE